MNRSRLIASLLACLLASAFSPVLAAQQTPLRIGTWNIEFFGAPKNHRRDLPPRDPQDLPRIAAFIRELGVSVLAVQEVCGEAPVQELARALGPKWSCVIGTSGSWNDGATSQSLGFLYDGARVELLWAEELLQFPRERDELPIFHRVPVTACFRDRQTGMDFRAVTVHLKASMKPTDLRKRELEATALRDWLLLLQATPEEDQDVVVLGDFNSTYGTEPQLVLESAGAVRYLRQLEPEPTIMHFPEPIDQIAVSPRFTEIVPSTFDSHSEAAGADPQQWRQTFSDHFPVTVELRADGDDDPGSVFSHGDPAHVLPVALRAAAPATAAATAPQDPAPTAAASPRAAARRLGAPPPGSPPPVEVGDRVEVYLTPGLDPNVTRELSVRGALLHPLTDWVYVRDDVSGAVRVFPASHVFEVRLLQ